MNVKPNYMQTARPHRSIAKAAGEKFYNTGRPCKHGHTADRKVSDGICLDCKAIREATRGAEKAAYQRATRAKLTADPVAAEATRAAWAEWQRERRKKFPEMFRARERKHGRLKRQKYPERKNAETRAYRLKKIQRTPQWADLRAIRDFYENCPDGMEVDHIVPLRGKTVSGFHVLNNLQYLPKMENRLKGSKFDARAMETLVMRELTGGYEMRIAA